MELLLLSNSTLPGEDFFHWPRPYVAEFLSDKKRIGFVPFALPEDQHDMYVEKVAAVFSEMGCETIGLHNAKDAKKALDPVDVIAVGGGNSFLLLRSLYRSGLIRAIADRVKNGMPYMGWSAGGNVACPTIMTTNDMPIVEPPSMRALHLVPFQINPHYTEVTIPGHGGEGRDQRIAEFLAVNQQMPVAGLREGALLHVTGGTMRLEGRGMRVFRHGEEPKEVPGGTDLRASLHGL